MKITKLSTEIRKPTVQYGCENYVYEVEVDETDESIENVVRHIHKEHEKAIESLEYDRENRRKLKRITDSSDAISF